MGLRHPLLIVALALASPRAAAAATGCLACHPVHYRDLGECTLCHRGDPRSGRREIAHHELVLGRFAHFAVPGSAAVGSGRKLLEQAGCRRCHVSGGRGNRLAADLDRLLPGARPQEVLEAILKPALLMPDFAFREPAAVALVNALLAGSATAPRRSGEATLVVHFEAAPRRENPFERHCGGCHRVLTRRWGGLGAGAVGPNLSGLFSEHYPAPARDGERWTPAVLRRWLENPRQVRPHAVMPPVTVTAEELEALRAILEPSAVEAAGAPR